MTSLSLMLSILNHSHNFSKKIPFTDISNQITDRVKELVQLAHSIKYDDNITVTSGCIRLSSNLLKKARISILLNQISDLTQKIPQTDIHECYHQILIGRIECFYERHFAKPIDEEDLNISSKALISDLNYFKSLKKIED